MVIKTIKKIIKPFIPLSLIQKKSDFICLIKSYRNIKIICKKNKNAKFILYSKLINQIIETKRNDTCHIIATGASAIQSYKDNIIGKDDFIIGMNFSAFLPYNFDYYFCEDESNIKESDDLIKKQIELLLIRKDKINNIIFKNLYNCKPGNFTKELLSFNIYLLMDRQIIVNQKVERKIHSLVKKSRFSIAQYGSTAITATILAFHTQFKNIVIHGVDLTGPHLYHNLDFQREIGMTAPTPYVNKDVSHSTNFYQESIWPELINHLKKSNVNIYSATTESNFTKFASVYTPSSFL